MERRRVEAEVGADVREAEREKARSEREPKLRRQHRLVGEVDDDLGVARLLDDRDAVVRLAAQLLGAADQHHADELVRQLARAPRARPRDSAPRRRSRQPSPVRRHLPFDPSGVLLVRLRLRRELDDALLAVEWVLPPDVHVRPGDLDDVVTGSSVPSQAGRGNRAGVDDEEILEPPGVRHVLVAREDEIDAGALQALERVARVVDDVPLAARFPARAADGGGRRRRAGRPDRRTAPRSSRSGRARSARCRGRARSSRRRRS